MSTSFEFDDSTLGTGGYLAQGQLTRSSSAGASSAVLRGRTISSSTDVDVLAITLVAGRSYLFDIDQGFGDSSGSLVDLQLSLINARGVSCCLSAVAAAPTPDRSVRVIPPWQRP